MEKLGRAIFENVVAPRNTSRRGATLPTDTAGSALPLREPCPRCHGVEWLERPDREWVRCPCMAVQDNFDSFVRRAKASNLPHPAHERTIGNFERVEGTEEAVAAVLIFGEPSDPTRILTLAGGKGTGKSHLLEAAGRLFLDTGMTVRYELCADLLKRCRAGFHRDAEEGFNTVWEGYLQVDLLVLDDLGGMDSQTPWGVGALASLIDDRWRTEKYLAVSTNLGMKDVARQMDERVADRLWDARSGLCRVVQMTCPSYRTGETW